MSSEKDNTSTLKAAVGVLGLSTVALLGATIGLAVKSNSAAPAAAPAPADDAMSAVAVPSVSEATDFIALRDGSTFLDDTDNVCAGAQLAVANKLCADLEVPTPQAGGNVTKGYVGDLDVGDLVPITTSYQASNMCPVNVHWHLGTEHYSYGQFDENGDGPHGTAPRPEWADRDLAGKDVRGGFRCHHYDAEDEKFTKPYEWKYCTNMEVGETYEVHWPHSSAGDCGTVNQFQTPFYDGVFCNLPLEVFQTIAKDPQNIASNVGVHGQVFTVVNDEAYFYPDMMRGMIVDKSKNMGTDIHYYTGSTTGTSRDNEMCSQYAPITWQVDRQCHMISASSFDKLCYDMKLQRDDMTDDLYPHGSRELVMDSLVANNAADGPGRNLRA
eukprot:CAMPEP_0201690232 /NCGR_PEP_ID=MMETSP0578-20130828/3698_1 /ASSEMBLY_ACC=CAM_ASM_000663 /TAXON_ID=267565 /ORGANISM="Skeletonema grethea, Strain CCMP 1804" /LENGTH=383 /DNA_ID=CAMNT_0048175149 /DNA_START=119 /DNA_END=1270 /DNA_ORIENTATION=+